MRKILIAFIFVSSLLFANPINDKKKYSDTGHTSLAYHSSHKKAERDSFAKALEIGKISANLKFFHMIRTFDDTEADTKAFTAGGIVKYESKVFHKLQFAFAYYGSHKIGNLYSRSEGIRTSLLQSNGEDIAFLGEAYLQYDMGNTTLKVGRQRLDTPLMGDLYLRVLPTAYEAVILKNRDLPKTMIELGYVKSFTGFGSHYSHFDDKHTEWGKDGLGYIYFKNSSIENLSMRGEYIQAIAERDKHGTAIDKKNYTYVDLKYNLPQIGASSYLKAQYGGNRYNNAADSTLLGLKAGTTFLGMFDTTLFYDKISGNNFEVIMSSPMFSDWQQGYGLYEPSSAMGASVLAKPVKDLSVRLVYVDVSSHTEKLVDDFSEFNFDLKYKFNNWSKLRISYSIKNQSAGSERLLRTGKGGREDRDDFRIIYTMSF